VHPQPVAVPGDREQGGADDVEAVVDPLRRLGDPPPAAVLGRDGVAHGRAPRLLLTRDPRKRASSRTEITALDPLSGPPRAHFRPSRACPRGHRDLSFAVDDELRGSPRNPLLQPYASRAGRVANSAGGGSAGKNEPFGQAVKAELRLDTSPTCAGFPLVNSVASRRSERALSGHGAAFPAGPKKPSRSPARPRRGARERPQWRLGLPDRRAEPASMTAKDLGDPGWIEPRVHHTIDVRGRFFVAHSSWACLLRQRPFRRRPARRRSAAHERSACGPAGAAAPRRG